MNTSTGNYKFTKSPKDFTRNVFYLTLGGLLATFLPLLVILSIPVFVFRVVVVLLAKWARPDLGNVLNPLSTCFAQDLFTKMPPRANAVISIKLQREIPFGEECWKELVMKNLIEAEDEKTHKLKYPEFQQYPTKWLGFTFYKDASNSFNINNHLYFHGNPGGRKVVTKEDLQILKGKLLNVPNPPDRSPWEIHILYNYQNEESQSTDGKTTIFLLKVHHSLADGYSVLHTVGGSLFELPILDENIPSPRVKRKSAYELVKYYMCLPFNVMYEEAYLLSQWFRPSPWKIPDEKKGWHQHSLSSHPIPIQAIKDIKNAFGVSFTSVLLSAISAGIHKNLEAKRREHKWNPGEDPGTMGFCTVLPLPGHTKRLTNHMTFAAFEMPTIYFHNSVDRLQHLEETLETTKHSITPFLSRILVCLWGSHVTSVCSWISKQISFSAGLSNFPSVPMLATLKVGDVSELDYITGASHGESGMLITVLSYNKNIVISSTAEKGLISKEELSTFIDDIVEELKELERLIKKRY